MFNPFKKKDTGFKLDESSLPSLSDIKENTPIAENIHTNSSPELNTNTNLNLPDLNTQNSMPIDETPIPVNNPFETQNSFSGPMNLSEPQQTPIQNMHNDIVKAKIDAMESKITLIDAKLSSIEQKLELLNKLILEEVSEDTKRKLKINSMMSNIKKE
jgi:hypothetical protein